MKKLIAIACAVLAGCATSPGIVPIGQDTYMVSYRDSSPGASLGSIKAAAFKDATQYCTSQGKLFQVVRTNDVPRAFGQFPESEVQFMCLDKDDPELARPRLRKEADRVVETRSR